MPAVTWLHQAGAPGSQVPWNVQPPAVPMKELDFQTVRGFSSR
jgi:hypothetical protein